MELEFEFKVLRLEVLKPAFPIQQLPTVLTNALLRIR